MAEEKFEAPKKPQRMSNFMRLKQMVMEQPERENQVTHMPVAATLPLNDLKRRQIFEHILFWSGSAILEPEDRKAQ